MVSTLEKVNFDDSQELISALLTAVIDIEARLSALEEVFDDNE